MILLEIGVYKLNFWKIVCLNAALNSNVEQFHRSQIPNYGENSCLPPREYLNSYA